MTKQKNYKSLIFYFLMSLILLDFGNELKKISYSFLDYTSPFDNPFITIIHTKNFGCAFSLFQNMAPLFAILGLIAVIFIGYYIFRFIPFKNKFSLIILTLLSGGTLGNMIERLKFGYVVDYIKLKGINFPVFNAFDMMICLSIILYLIFILIDYKKEENKDEKA